MVAVDDDDETVPDDAAGNPVPPAGATGPDFSAAVNLAKKPLFESTIEIMISAMKYRDAVCNDGTYPTAPTPPIAASQYVKL